MDWSNHKHSYGPWELWPQDAYPEGMEDKDAFKYVRFEPMWHQGCVCGYSNCLRSYKRPTKSSWKNRR